MRHHKLAFFVVLLLILLLIGAGLVQTYQAIQGTVGRPMPVLWEFKNHESQWEFSFLGSHYTVPKYSIRLENLQDCALQFINNVTDQGKILWLITIDTIKNTTDHIADWVK